MREPTLLYPTIDLFLYDLQDGLGHSAEEIAQIRHGLWQGILNGNFTETTLADIKAREATLSNYIELLPQRYQFFAAPYDGYYYPVKLGDTLAVQVDCAGKPEEPTWDALSLDDQLQQMKASVLEHARDIPGRMGRSWFIWGRLTTADQDPEASAINIFKTLKLFPQSNWALDCKGKGRYGGATFYEIQKVDETADGINQNHYALICLFPASQTKADMQGILSQLYRHLMRLLYYRNKVLWAYEQGFQLKTKLKEAINKVQILINILPGHIAQPAIALNSLQQDLAKALTISHYCEKNLSFLKEQAATISINLDNYQKRLQLMSQSAGESDLAVLERFADFAQEKYLNQLKTDEQTLAVSLKPLATFIQTVEGVIEIEKAKNDRTLNQTVAIASVGISVASLAASTFTEQAKTIIEVRNPTPSGQPIPVSNSIKSAGLAFGVSLAIGLLGACMTWLLLKAWNRR